MLYSTTIPIFIYYLTVLEKILGKGRVYASKKKWKEERLLAAKLAPDMYTLTQQVQYAYFTALEAATLLSGRPMPSDFAYDETSIKALTKSLRNAIAFLSSIKESELKSADRKKVTSFLSPKEKFSGAHYVHFLAMPNFFFHVTTSYDILRHLGVPLKKKDYLGV